MSDSAIMQTLIRGTAGNTWVQLFRYTLVGGVAFTVDFSTLVFLTEVAGVNYLISAAIGFLFGLSTNYGLNILWVFHRRHIKSRRLEFALFAAIGCVSLASGEFLIYAFTEWAGFHYMGSKLLTSIIIYFWNFWARRTALFR